MMEGEPRCMHRTGTIVLVSSIVLVSLYDSPN